VVLLVVVGLLLLAVGGPLLLQQRHIDRARKARQRSSQSQATATPRLTRPPSPTPTPGPYPVSESVPPALDEFASLLFRCDSFDHLKCFQGFDPDASSPCPSPRKAWADELEKYADQYGLAKALEQLCDTTGPAGGYQYCWAKALALHVTSPSNQTVDDLLGELSHGAGYGLWIKGGPSIAYLAYQLTLNERIIDSLFDGSMHADGPVVDELMSVNRCAMTAFPVQSVKSLSRLPFQHRIFKLEFLLSPHDGRAISHESRQLVWSALAPIAKTCDHPMRFEAQLAMSIMGDPTRAAP
jgi:hypothetical protein